MVQERFYDWLIDVFGPVLLRVAPDIPPSFDPEKIRAGEAKPMVSEYLLPKV